MTETQEVAFDLSRIVDASYDGQWVAIAPDYSRVVASAKTLSELLDNKLDEEVIFHKVLPRDASFAPATL